MQPDITRVLYMISYHALITRNVQHFNDLTDGLEHGMYRKAASRF